MKLSKKDITQLRRTGRLADMPKGMYVAGFDDYDGGYYPIYTLDEFFHSDVECELVTHLTQSLGGVECYLRFI